MEPKTAAEKLVDSEQILAGLSTEPWAELPADLAAVMRPYLPGVGDAIIEGIRREVPAYALPLEGAFGAALRTGVGQALDEFVALIEDPRFDRSQGRDVYKALGRGEARVGRSLEALLAAYRVGARVAWRQIAARARAEGIRAEILALLAEAIFAYIDELSADSAEGYAEEQARAAAETDRLRRRVVRLLAGATPPEPAAVEAAAAQARWELPEALAALVWPQTPRRVGARLPAGSIATVVDELNCALVPDPDGPGRGGQLRAAIGDGEAVLGPTVHWTRGWMTARQALAAQRLRDQGRIDEEAGVVLAEEHLPDLILGQDPALADALRERALAPLEGETARSRERLSATLEVWLENQGAVAATAAALHVHPQTVRYRLARLRELFLERLDDPDRRFELAIALRLGPERSSGS